MSRRQGNARAVVAALPSVLALILLAFAARWFLMRWRTAAGEGLPPGLGWGWLAVSFALLTAHSLATLATWKAVIASVGHPLGWRAAPDTFVPALLARYVPGKIWANAARLALARRAGVSLAATTGALLWETLVALTTGGILALLALQGHADANTRRAAALLAAVTLGAWVVLALLARGARSADFVRRLGALQPARSPGVMVKPLATALIGWFFFAAAHFAVIRAIAPVGPDAFPLVAGAVALAWAAGFAAIVVPVGLGVRDGLLLVLLAPLLAPAQALLFVALSRLVQLAVDAAMTAGWLAARARSPHPG